MPLTHGIARFNRRVTNRVTGRFAGWLPGFGIVVHTGRRSGREYRTPVNAFRDGEGYIIALTYGAEADWVRNVLAAGRCELLTRGRRVALAHPRLVADPSRRWAPLPVRLILGLIGASQILRLECVRAPLPDAGDAADAARAGAAGGS
jgi:deazaflavin-dependent oxidoreductase (nitroreductase family)